MSDWACSICVSSDTETSLLPGRWGIACLAEGVGVCRTRTRSVVPGRAQSRLVAAGRECRSCALSEPCALN